MRTIYSAMFHNLFIKITALTLAVLTWSYIVGQLYRELPEEQKHSSAVVKLADKNVIVKRLPIHVNLVGTPNARYNVAIERIRIKPSEVVITGAPEKIEPLSFIVTEPISIQNLTKTIRARIRVKQSKDYTISRGQIFSVVIPIERKRVR